MDDELATLLAKLPDLLALWHTWDCLGGQGVEPEARCDPRNWIGMWFSIDLDGRPCWNLSFGFDEDPSPERTEGRTLEEALQNLTKLVAKWPADIARWRREINEDEDAPDAEEDVTP